MSNNPKTNGKVRARVLKELRRGASTRGMIAKRLGLQAANTGWHLKELVKRGQVVNPHRGLYQAKGGK